MLLDPFEEQFDLPAALVERADRRGRQPELIGEEHQRFSRFGVPEADAPQVFRGNAGWCSDRSGRWSDRR